MTSPPPAMSSSIWGISITVSSNASVTITDDIHINMLISVSILDEDCKFLQEFNNYNNMPCSLHSVHHIWIKTWLLLTPFSICSIWQERKQQSNKLKLLVLFVLRKWATWATIREFCPIRRPLLKGGTVFFMLSYANCTETISPFHV